MSFVIDASFAAAWLMPEEHSAIVEGVIREMAGRAPVPSLFWDEVRNILAMAERRRRIAPEEAFAAMSRLRRLPIATIASTADAEILRLASTHQMTAYDAAYRETAISTQRPLATLDRALARTAAASRVEVLGPYA